MRRIALMLLVGSCCMLVLVCVLGSLTLWYREGSDMVLPGASNVRIDGRGTAHLHITYDLSSTQRLHSVRDHFLQRGWRRVRVQGANRFELVFGRRSWLGVIQEVAIVNIDPTRRPVTDISVVRCLRIASWASCAR